MNRLIACCLSIRLSSRGEAPWSGPESNARPELGNKVHPVINVLTTRTIGSATKHYDRATNAHFRPDKSRGATGKSLIVLNPWLTLNQRVPALVRPPRKKPSFPIASRNDGREQSGSRATFFCVGGHGRIAVRLFLCFCIFTPFDTARRPDGT